MQHKTNPLIFRAYDIRGTYNETLFNEDAFLIASAYAEYAKEKLAKNHVKIALCRDGRISSPALHSYMVTGFKNAGVEIVDIGVGPSPLLYFAVHHQNLDGGVMITGSHNPKNHNGFKFMLGKNALFGEEISKIGLKCQAIAGGYFLDDIAKHEKATAAFLANTTSQNAEASRVFNAYVQKLLSVLNRAENNKHILESLNIIWDAGNGAAGEILTSLRKKLPGNHKMLFTEIDGNFPNHHPDPSKQENIRQLSEAVSQNNADCGIAFDGDADRIGVVDNNANLIRQEHLLAIYAEEILGKEYHKNSTIISDVKASQFLFDYIAELGGKPLMWKTGHSFVKAKMKAENSPLGGEMSGHIFFADEYYGFDDGIYAAMRLLNIIAALKAKGISLAEKLNSFQQSFSTGEIRLPIKDEEKFNKIEEIKARLKAKQINFTDIDGVRINNQNGFLLIRASNTAAEIVTIAESQNKEDLEKIKQYMQELLAN